MALPAAIRFGCVDCIYDLLPNALHISRAQGLVLRGGRGDRVIHDVLIRWMRASGGIDNELVGDLVERTPEVLDDIGGNSCQWQRNEISLADVVNALSGISVFLVTDGLWIGGEKRPHSCVRLVFDLHRFECSA